MPKAVVSNGHACTTSTTIEAFTGSDETVKLDVTVNTDNNGDGYNDILVNLEITSLDTSGGTLEDLVGLAFDVGDDSKIAAWGLSIQDVTVIQPTGGSFDAPVSCMEANGVTGDNKGSCGDPGFNMNGGDVNAKKPFDAFIKFNGQGANDGTVQEVSFLITANGATISETMAKTILDGTDWFARMMSTDGGEGSSKALAFINAVDCTPSCGDGDMDTDETCDYGITNPSTAGYAALCRTETSNDPCTYCGDGQVQANSGEDCDGTNFAAAYSATPHSCDGNCKATPLPYCGDGMVNGDEECEELGNGDIIYADGYSSATHKCIAVKCEVVDIGVVVGDPHVFTFDGLTNDCQGIGQFILVKSQVTSRQVQTRFEHLPVSGASHLSVTKAIVVQDAGESPIVQVNVGGSPAPNDISGCGVQFFVDGVQLDLDNGSGQADVTVTKTSSEVEIFYSASGFRVKVTAAHGGGTCFLNQVVYLPEDDSTIIGLMGTPNGDPMDDWTTRDGTPIDVPVNAADRVAQGGYDYCTANWCITNAAESLYHDATGTVTAVDMQQCSTPYGGDAVEISDLIATASDAVKAICGNNNQCLLDGAIGGVVAAQATMDALQAVTETCNMHGGECGISSCCDGLECHSVPGSTAKECVEPTACYSCWGTSSGECQDPNNMVCFARGADGSCVPGTHLCHTGNVFSTPPVPADCTECWPGTSGPCKATNGVCYPLVGGICPGGTLPCDSVRRNLRRGGR